MGVARWGEGRLHYVIPRLTLEILAVFSLL